MRILLLIDHLVVGGAETHVVSLAQELQRRGHWVCVVSDGGVLEKALVASDVKTLHFPASVRQKGFGTRALGLAWFLRGLQLRLRFDVMHAHTRRTALLLRLLDALGRGARSLSVGDGEGRPAFRPRGLRRLSRPLFVVTAHARFSPRYKHFSYWGDQTIAVSRDLSDHLQASLGFRRTAVVIPNGIDLHHFAPTERARPQGVLHVVFASRLDEDCSAAAEALLSVAPALCQVLSKDGLTLCISLLGGGTRYQALSKAAAELQAAEPRLAVRAVGAVSDPAPYFQKADVFVGVSRAALEAAASGACVILCGNEGMGGVLCEDNFDAFARENFCCRSCPPVEDGALLAALLALSKLSHEQRTALSSGVLRRLSASLSLGCTTEQTLALYQKGLFSRRALRVLIAGYAGCGNLGDDAILRRLVARWQGAQAPLTLVPDQGSSCSLPSGTHLTLTSLAARRKKASAAPFGIDLVPRRSPLALVRAIAGADALVLGGGTLIQNVTAHPRRSLCYYLSLLRLAHVLGCPFYLVANGIGPLHGAGVRRRVGRVLARARGISVRDELSLALLQTMGLGTARVVKEADPVLSLPAPDQAARDRARRRWGGGVIWRRAVCIVARGSEMGVGEALLGGLAASCHGDGVYPLFFVFDRVKDTQTANELCAALGTGRVIKSACEEEVAALFSLSAGVVSMRLHGLILATVASVPAVALCHRASDPKLAAFASERGLPLLDNNPTSEQIAQAIGHFFL